jgi:hypothetical protein
LGARLNPGAGSGIKRAGASRAIWGFHVKSRAISLASAAAALFIAGASGHAFAAEEGASEAKIKCEGVNECKGKGACSSAKNSCAGKNACKGQGYEMMTPEECAAAKEKQSQK